MKKEIGGFLEVKLQEKKEYHNNSIRFNLARHAINFLIKKKRYKKIYLPKYISDTVYNTINIKIEFYDIDKNFYPILNLKSVNKSVGSALLYPNYFGINNNNITKLKKKIKNLIIDNVHAFFHKPKNLDVIYSARKFFGVPDGAYLVSSDKFDVKISKDYSFDRYTPLLKKIELGSDKSYLEYLKIEKRLNKAGPRSMSKLTSLFLKSFDYSEEKKIRKKNFDYFHNKIGSKNLIKIPHNRNNFIPMIYPFLNNNNNIKKFIRNKIYLPCYYKKSKHLFKKNSFENFLIEKLLALPIDSRVNKKDIDYMISILKY